MKVSSILYGMILQGIPSQALQPSARCHQPYPAAGGSTETSRGMVIATLISSVAAVVIAPSMSNAVQVLNEDGEYEEVQEQDWQAAWKGRLDKASSMSPDEVFMAARGAGNLDLKNGPESDASKKRRAMAACRDGGLRKKAGVDSKECTSRVLNGEVEFMLSLF